MDVRAHATKLCRPLRRIEFSIQQMPSNLMPGLAILPALSDARARPRFAGWFCYGRAQLFIGLYSLGGLDVNAGLLEPTPEFRSAETKIPSVALQPRTLR